MQRPPRSLDDPIFFELKTSREANQRGLSLLELFLVISLILLLGGLLVPISATFKKRAEKAKCLSHMRTLHTCFVAHITDKGQWPQMSADGEEGDAESEARWSEDGFFRFWVSALEPYGASQDTWLCPSDKLVLQMSPAELARGDFFGSYVPTPFETGPGTPFRWNQPWLIERGDFHGKGAHILMPDGSVTDSQNPFHGR